MQSTQGNRQTGDSCPCDTGVPAALRVGDAPKLVLGNYGPRTRRGKSAGIDKK